MVSNGQGIVAAKAVRQGTGSISLKPQPVGAVTLDTQLYDRHAPPPTVALKEDRS
jgi:hypothetical protein